MNTIKGLLLTLGLAAAATSCATYRTVKVESTPTGAEVLVDGKVVGQTPLATTLIYSATNGDRRINVRVRKPGYRDAVKAQHQRDGDNIRLELEPAGGAGAAGPY